MQWGLSFSVMSRELDLGEATSQAADHRIGLKFPKTEGALKV